MPLSSIRIEVLTGLLTAKTTADGTAAKPLLLRHTLARALFVEMNLEGGELTDDAIVEAVRYARGKSAKLAAALADFGAHTNHRSAILEAITMPGSSLRAYSNKCVRYERGERLRAELICAA